MSRMWKSLVVVSLMLNGVCLLYVYALLNPNPHGRQYYETEQIKMDLAQVKDELAAMRAARPAASR